MHTLKKYAARAYSVEWIALTYVLSS